MAFTLTVILMSMYYTDTHKDVEAADTLQAQQTADIKALFEHII